MAVGNYPAIFVLEPPGTKATGLHKYRCMICTTFWRISDSSYQTLHDMRRDSKMYVVACYGCFQELEPRLPAEMHAGRQEATVREARQIMGFQ